MIMQAKNIPDNVTVHEFGSGASLKAQGYRLVMALFSTPEDVLDMVCPDDGMEVAITYGGCLSESENVFQFFIAVRIKPRDVTLSHGL